MNTENFNIILINIDGFRKDRLDLCSHLKEIKENSLYFSNMNTVAPYTFASLHAIFSGLYPSKNGVNGYYNIFKFKKNNITTFPELLQKNGYFTSYDIIHDSVIPAQGFDEKNVFDEKTVDFPNRHSELIEKLSSKKKFFLFLHYTETHKHLVDSVIQKYKNDSNSDDYFKNKNENEIRFNSYMPLCNSYIKSIIETLHKTGIYDKTILILFADHGTSLGEKLGEKFYGVYVYDYTVNVFCILKIPNIDNKIINKQCSTLDIYPTILELAHIDKDTRYALDGSSLLDFLKNNGEKDRTVFVETGGLYGPWPSPEEHNVFCIKANSKKLIYNKTPNTWEFYDLELDPHEKNNLFNEKSLEIENYKKIMREYMQQNKIDINF